jgi:ABC-type antimicrobial peptide transport system permease subunit
MPFVINGKTCAFAAAAVAAAGLLSGLVVARRLQQMDLTAVLKSRE